MKKLFYFVERYSIIIVLLASIPLILPYFHHGYFPTHDGEWAVVRAAEMFREIRDHQFPPRYSGVLNFGYGYPLFNFTYPLPYYLTTILHIFRFGFVDSVKALFTLSVVFSALGMYCLSSKLWNQKIAGILSAILYIYFPYRIVDLYVRGSLGESVAFMMVPWALYFLISWIQKRTLLHFVLSSISISLLILSHNIMALYFVPLIILFAYLYGKQMHKRTILPLLFSLLLGISLSAFFILPAIIEKNYIALSKIPIADRNLYFASLDQLIFPKWGYGTPTDKDGFGYQIGVSYIIILLSTISYFFLKRGSSQMKKHYETFAAVGVVLSIVIILFMFQFTEKIWKITPLLSEINYPWTLLGPLGFVISLISGFIFIHMKFGKHIIILASIFAVILVIPYAHPKEYVNRGDNFYMTNEATTTSSDELMPIWVEEKPTKRFDEKVEIKLGNIRAKDITYNSKSLKFINEFFSHTKETHELIQINTIYYPGWHAFIDDQEIPIYYGKYGSKEGVMQLWAPDGSGQTIRLEFRETPLRIIADGISLVAFGIVILSLLFFELKRCTKFLK